MSLAEELAEEPTFTNLYGIGPEDHSLGPKPPCVPREL